MTAMGDGAEKAVWTAAQDAELKRLARESLSAREIGARLGRSRGAVIGRLHRLGLNLPRRTAGDAAARQEHGVRRRLAARAAPAISGRDDPPAAPAVAPAQQDDSFPEGSAADFAAQGIAFAALRRGRCRFPLWRHDTRPELAAMVFCGEATGAGDAPYCRAHHALCHAPVDGAGGRRAA